MRASQDLGQIFLPRIFYGRLKKFPIVEVLQGSEVVPQVLDRLHVVLLLCCKNGVKRLQLDRKKQRPTIEANLSAFVTVYVRVFEYVCAEYNMSYRTCICSHLPAADCSQTEHSICKKHSHHRHQQAQTSIIILATYRAVTSQWGKFVAIDCYE